jgi:murein DD-endopeptidase MepM/ murein hydrolase activator NlpD
MSLKCRVLKSGYCEITQGYKKGYHDGIDLVNQGYTLGYVVAHSSGVVVSCRRDYKTQDKTGNSYGNYVKIKHDDGYYTLYAHLAYNTVTVKNGDRVSRGQVIGYMGATGRATAGHLHWEVRNKSDVRIDPRPYLDKDLPSNAIDYTGTITYQAYTNKWLEEVKKCDNTNEGYAGIYKEPITAFRCKPQYGEIIYEAHELNGKWLGAVNSKDYSNGSYNSYAGILGKKIDGIRIKSTKGYVDYRVHTIEDGWLDWARGFGDSGNQFAGIYGHTVDGIQMK